jgi:branched-chain amino acid transport system ATP-binding protein
VLDVTGLEVRYGSVTAVKGVSLEVAEGEVVAIIGPNGAGKTSTLRAITGLVPSAGGRVVFRGTDVSRWKAHRIVTLGLGHAPEGRRLFPQMTVMENLRMGAYRRRVPSEIGRTLAQVEELFPRLAERRTQLAGTLSGGEQQMLAIGRALMAEPRLLVLDEPSFGLAPLIVREIGRIVRTINRERGVSVLLVEQNARMALGIAARAYVMETGRVALSGPSAALAESPHVKAAYLGG